MVGSGSEVVAHTYYFHKNHLGSIVGITDISGNVVSEYEYDSYGNFSLSGSDIGNTRLFTGREFDFEIGLYYNRARYYSSELGRFISRDPIGQVDDVNLYAYVANNPVMFNDLNGETKQFIAGSTLGDYNENGNGWSIAGQIATGFIPYYGQVADVRDFSYQWENGSSTDIAFAGIAFIPGVGDGAKALRNSGIFDKIEKITNKYENLQCIKCAKELEKLLKKEGVEYEKIILKGGMKGNIYSEKFGEAISTNGYHEAIKIGDIVFDNINKTGIKYNDFIKDLGIGIQGGPNFFK